MTLCNTFTRRNATSTSPTLLQPTLLHGASTRRRTVRSSGLCLSCSLQQLFHTGRDARSELFHVFLENAFGFVEHSLIGPVRKVYLQCTQHRIVECNARARCYPRFGCSVVPSNSASSHLCKHRQVVLYANARIGGLCAFPRKDAASFIGIRVVARFGGSL